MRQPKPPSLPTTRISSLDQPTAERLTSWGGRLSILGLAMVAAAVIGAVATLGPEALSGGALSDSEMAAVAGIGLIGLVGAVAGVVGVAAYVILPARAGFAERNYASLRNAIAMLVLAAILANLVQLPILLSDPSLMRDSLTNSSSVDPFSLPPVVLFVAITSLQIFLVAIVYVRIIAPGVMNWAALGLVGHNFTRNLWIGFIAWVLLLGASFALSAGLDAIGIKQNQAELFSAVKDAPLHQFLLVLLAGAILAPIGEEIFFRGFLFTSLLKERGQIVAYGASSLLFAVVHFNLPALVPILVLGVGLAIARRVSGSLLAPIVAHSLNNLFALSVLYFADIPAP